MEYVAALRDYALENDDDLKSDFDDYDSDYVSVREDLKDYLRKYDDLKKADAKELKDDSDKLLKTLKAFGDRPFYYVKGF